MISHFKNLIRLVIVFFGSNMALHTNAQMDRVQWAPAILTCDYFTIVEDSNRHFASSFSVDRIFCGIRGPNCLEIQNIFLPQASFRLSECDTFLLTKAQTLFDAYEVEARIIRKKISSKKGRDSEELLKMINMMESHLIVRIDHIENKLNLLFQEKKLKKIAKFKKKIRRRLSSLNEYSSTEVLIK